MQFDDYLNEEYTLNDSKLNKARELKRRAKESSLLSEIYALQKQRIGKIAFKKSCRPALKMEGTVTEGVKSYLKALFIPPLLVFPIALIIALIIGVNSRSSSGGWLSITKEGVIVILTFIFTILGSGAAITLTTLLFITLLLRRGRGKSALTLAILYLLTAGSLLTTIFISQQ